MVLSEAVAEAAAVLDARQETAARIARLMEVIEGFESMHGMELLASVHWAATHDAEARECAADAVRVVQGWNARKKRTFTEHQITVAWEALRDRGMLPSDTLAAARHS